MAQDRALLGRHRAAAQRAARGQTVRAHLSAARRELQLAWQSLWDAADDDADADSAALGVAAHDLELLETACAPRELE